jgi:hypothetical protein
MKWRKATYSNGEGSSCVEVARTQSQQIATRDSKNPTGPQLRFNRHEWAAFLAEIKSQEHNLS